MKKRYLLLLLLIACAPVQETIPAPVEMPVIQEPVQVRAILLEKIDDYLINKAIDEFSMVSSDAIYDSFGIIPVERYDALYKSDDVWVLVHVFKFSTRQELDVVVKSEFYLIVNRGASRYNGHTLALYLTQDDHRSAVWSSGNMLVYVETFLPDFSERRVVDAYLRKYPSDLETEKCFDSDGDEHFVKGTTEQVKTGSLFMKWTDVCLRDFPLYRNKQYVPRKGLSEEDGLLEGRCERDIFSPGFISEYECPRGCIDGACKLS